jgi:hypothetical protein
MKLKTNAIAPPTGITLQQMTNKAPAEEKKRSLI